MTNGTDPPRPEAPTVILESIPSFSGEGSVRVFLGYIEDYGQLIGWNDKQKVQVAKLKLTGDARRLLEWNDKLRDTDTWEEWSAELKKRYERPVFTTEATLQFRTCKQRVGESVTDFSERLQVLAATTYQKTGDGDKDRWRKEHLKEECLEQFMEGLLMPIGQRVMSAQPATFENAVALAIREEFIEKRTGKGTYQRKIEVNLPAATSTAVDEETEKPYHQGSGERERPNDQWKANYNRVRGPDGRPPHWLGTNQPHRGSGTPANTNARPEWGRNRTSYDKSNITCYRCGRQGHIQRECRQRQQQYQNPPCCTHAQGCSRQGPSNSRSFFASRNQERNRPLNSSRTEPVGKVTVRQGTHPNPNQH